VPCRAEGGSRCQQLHSTDRLLARAGAGARGLLSAA
jgi:hypothetical protein